SLMKAGTGGRAPLAARCCCAAVAHQSSWIKVLAKYFAHSCPSTPSRKLPSAPSTSCALGIWIIAETGRQPSSERKARMPTAARTPPHCPAEYVTIALGLYENNELPK